MNMRTAADEDSPPGRPPPTDPLSTIPNQRRRARSASLDESTAPADIADTAYALIYPPSGRARQWCAIVQHCPWCQHAHRHRLDFYATAFVRAPSCRPWARYEVRTYLVLPGVPS